MIDRFFILLIVVLSISAERSRTRIPTNEEASCPSKCRCDRTNIDCRGSRHTSDVFRQIQSKAFPYLETLIFTGSNFGDISNNIFETTSLNSLSSVNLTDNDITEISSETFKNSQAIEYLHLNKNEIKKAGKDTFRYLQRLRRLDLNEALGIRSGQSKADLLSLMFDASSPTSHPELTEINLNNNHISMLHNDTFCRVSGLLKLDLANNNLSSFSVSPNCLQSLKALDLSGNNFTTIPASLWESLPVLTSLDISNNPLQCDCSLEPFLHIAKSENNDFMNQGHTYCAGPANLKGQNLFELRINLCQTSGYGFGTFLILLLLGATVLFGYRRFRRNNNHGPPFQFGYSGLNIDDEVQPEFV
ncbi:unnamed protein product [Auanema sp. JU1783]|nr:unnamed protein product [Auanema sp. JU1783]